MEWGGAKNEAKERFKDGLHTEIEKIKNQNVTKSAQKVTRTTQNERPKITKDAKIVIPESDCTIQKSSKIPKAIPIKDLRSEMGAFGGWVVAGPKGNVREDPAVMVLGETSKVVKEIDNKARIVKGQDPSLCSSGEKNLRTELNLAHNKSRPLEKPSEKLVVVSFDKSTNSAQFKENLNKFNIMSDNILPDKENLRKSADFKGKIDEPKPPQCHLCGAKDNCSCIHVKAASKLKTTTLGAVPKYTNIKVDKIGENREKIKSEEAIDKEKVKIRNLIAKYENPNRKSSKFEESENYIDKPEVIEVKLDDQTANEKKIMIRKFEDEKNTPENEMEFVKIGKRLNKENSKIDMEKIKNRNWLENWRLKKIENQKEKTSTPEKKITRKLVRSNKKKIGGKLENSPDIRIAFKKINDKKIRVERDEPDEGE